MANETFEPLFPAAYLDLAASPLGPGLRRQACVSAGVSEGVDDTYRYTVTTQAGLYRLEARRPSGLEVAVSVARDDAHQAMVWQIAVVQDAAMNPGRLCDMRALDLTIDGAMVTDPVIRTWLGGAMQQYFPPDAASPQARVLYPRTTAYYGAACSACIRAAGDRVTSTCPICSLPMPKIPAACGALSAGAVTGPWKPGNPKTALTCA